MFLGLGEGKIPGVLSPGSKYSREIEFMLSTNTGGSVYTGTMTDSVGTPIDWDKMNIRPEDINHEEWEAFWARFKTQVGQTWGDYTKMLNDNANYLAKLGTTVSDTKELLAFEVLQALGLGEPKILSQVEDAYCPGPAGPDLSFYRFFRSPLAYRNRLGTLGKGWTHNYQVSLRQRTDGGIIINGASVFERVFDYSNGRYTPQVGDYGSLTRQTDGSFVLTE